MVISIITQQMSWGNMSDGGQNDYCIIKGAYYYTECRQ